jgi:hypothetical protein
MAWYTHPKRRAATGRLLTGGAAGEALWQITTDIGNTLGCNKCVPVAPFQRIEKANSP